MSHPVHRCIPREAVAETWGCRSSPAGKAEKRPREEAVLCPCSAGLQPGRGRPRSCPDTPGAELEALRAPADQMTWAANPRPARTQPGLPYGPESRRHTAQPERPIWRLRPTEVEWLGRVDGPTRGPEARRSRPTRGGRAWGRRLACPRAFTRRAAVRGSSLRLGSPEHCGLQGCPRWRGGRGKKQLRRGCSRPEPEAGSVSWQRGPSWVAPSPFLVSPPPLKLRGVRAPGPEAEPRCDLGGATGVGGVTPGLPSCGPAFVRRGCAGGRGPGGPEGGATSLFPPSLRLLRLKRVFPVGLPSRVRPPQPPGTRPETCSTPPGPRARAGRWVERLERRESPGPGIQPGPRAPGPLFPIRWVPRATLTDGFGKASWVILGIKGPV